MATLIKRVSNVVPATETVVLTQELVEQVARFNTRMTVEQVVEAWGKGETIHTEFSKFTPVPAPHGGRDWHGECAGAGCHHCDYRGTV